MQTPTSRVLQLLELLQSAEARSVAELATRLDVNERTVRRYVQQLLDLDIPVESVRGRYGGYRLSAGHRMSPLILTDEEAVAVFLGLSRAQSASDGADVHAQLALAKIRRSLPEASAERLGELLEAAALGQAPGHELPDAGILLTVADAVRGRRPLDLRYRDAADAPSRRTVHPYELACYLGRWYVRAFDVVRQEQRTFRIDRIRTARALDGTFAADGSSATTLIDGFARSDYPWRVLLRVRSTEQDIRSHFPASIAVIQPLDRESDAAASEWHRVEIHAQRLDWLPGVIAGLECEVVVEEPDELRELLDAAATRLRRIAMRQSENLNA